MRIRAVTNSVRLFLISVVIASGTGCMSLEHVRTLEDARVAYSQAAAKDNRAVLHHLTPVTDPTDPTDSITLDTEYDEEAHARSHANYAFIARTLAALNRTHWTDLKNDRLLGLSTTLQLLAEWKASFYARLLGSEAPTLLDLKARRDAAVRLLDEEDAVVFARDRFLLEAMDPLLRYDNAFLDAVEGARSGDLASPSANRPTTQEELLQRAASRDAMAPRVTAIVDQMAKAEMRLAELGLARSRRHLRSYVEAARFAMLSTAIRIVLWSKIGGAWSWDSGPRWDDWTESEATTALPLLRKRRAAFLGTRPKSNLSLPPFWKRTY